MPKLFRGWPLLACLMAGGGLGNGASASELTLSRDGIQAIVLAEIFNDQGKWYFAKGVCYAYVDRPRVSLAAGRVIIGTTKAAYFSLDRFAEFLADAKLGLTRALNLDGGPPACQAVAIGTFRRSVCSNSETSSDAGQLRVLGQLFGQRPWGLPIVLAVFPK